MPSHRPYPELRPCHYRYGGPNDPNLSSSDGPATDSLEQLEELAQWYGGPVPRTPTIA